MAHSESISDSEVTILDLRNRVQKFVNERDWRQFHNPKDLAVSIAIEAAELMELFQWVKEKDVDNILKDNDKLNHLQEEIADIMIYCISLANSLKLNLAQVINDKIDKNAAKYPVHKAKGTAKKYTELR